MMCRSHFLEITREHISSLAVLAEIQTLAFFFFRDAQAHDSFERQQNNSAADSCECNRNADGSQLRHEQRTVAVEQSVVAGGVHSLRCEHTGQDGAENSTYAVHADDVE